MLGVNTGEQHQSEFDYLVASYHSNYPWDKDIDPEAEYNTKGLTTPDQLLKQRGIETPKGRQGDFMDINPGIPGMEQKMHGHDDMYQFGAGHQSESVSIDRDHHVPLVASALTDDKGQMYGMAIDHRVPAKPEYEKHLWNHEALENSYMNDLIKTGYTPQDAYHKAHDWSTARESAAVTAEFGEKGLEAYKQHWRDAASVAAEPTDKPRHPDAHTTRHGLDESELGQKFAADVHGKGSDMAGPYMPTTKEWKDLKPEEQRSLLRNAIPVIPGEGMEAGRKDILNAEDVEKRLNEEGSIRIWGNHPAVKEYLKGNHPDIERYDLREFLPEGYQGDPEEEGTIILRKIPALVAMNVPYPANDNLPPHNLMRLMDEAQQLLERLQAEKKGMGKVIPFKP